MASSSDSISAPVYVQYSRPPINSYRRPGQPRAVAERAIYERIRLEALAIPAMANTRERALVIKYLSAVITDVYSSPADGETATPNGNLMDCMAELQRLVYTSDAAEAGAALAAIARLLRFELAATGTVMAENKVEKVTDALQELKLGVDSTSCPSKAELMALDVSEFLNAGVWNFVADYTAPQ